ncbi:hypothetical protein B0H10DRAFT_2443543 [Mycena sp. CBHHK59/15]|nr:hypothetical protein B0H10DRAFT_2443543 [Mycena sp. CBHHK59/15]
MRTLNEDGQEVFELLSDSEADTDGRDSDLEVMEALHRTSRSSSTIPPCVTVDADDCPDDESECGDPSGMASSERNDESDNCDESDLFRPTRKTSVERMEYRAGPAALYPIHRVRTGIVVDLSDEKYRLRDPTTKKLYSLMSIIINADNDSWDWGGGGSRARAKVTFAPGETPVDCRRIRCDCKGAYACDQLDPALRDILRFELDSGPRNAIIAAQQETRRREGNTAEERVVLFMKVIRDAKCRAVDTKGNKCRGGPILKPKPHGSERNHQYFVGCSGWTPKFQQGHRTHPIPDNVDEDLLANALAGRPLTDDPAKDTPPCSGIIHPHTGLKKKYCSHAHIANGMQDWANPLVREFIQVYPEITDRISELNHADKWTKEVDLDDLSPMWADWSKSAHKHFYIKELAQLQNGKFGIPMRWVIFNKEEYAEVYNVVHYPSVPIVSLFVMKKLSGFAQLI